MYELSVNASRTCSYDSNCQSGTPAPVSFALSCERDQSASETVKLKEDRLCVLRERDRTRCATRSKEEGEVALLRMRAYSRSRVASETADDRQARLQRLRTCVRRLKEWRFLRLVPQCFAFTCICIIIYYMYCILCTCNLVLCIVWL